MKTWFITGASRGFGRIWAEAALDRGDRVAATARDPKTLQPLLDAHGDDVLPVKLDVTDRTAVTAAVRQAAETFGRLDVVVNNAGYGLFGMIEETTEEQARAQLDTNLFGPLWVTQAALPYLRSQGSGHILQVSSLGGLAAFPTLGLYNASKWALEGMSEALAQEVAPFGIHVTLVEPGPYGTDWSGASAVHTEPLPAYEPVRAARRAGASARAPQDARSTAAVVLELVDTDTPPLTPAPLPRHLPLSDCRGRLSEAARHVERVAAPRRPCVTGTEHPAAPRVCARDVLQCRRCLGRAPQGGCLAGPVIPAVAPPQVPRPRTGTRASRSQMFKVPRPARVGVIRKPGARTLTAVSFSSKRLRSCRARRDPIAARTRRVRGSRGQGGGSRVRASARPHARGRERVLVADETQTTVGADEAACRTRSTCLVTGASGYIGGRLVPELLDAGYRVRCLVRTPHKVRDHPWAGRVEIVRGDVTDAASVARAMADVDVAYYLVHALGTGRDFERTDREAARIFGEQARRAGIRRLVYLGGLTPVGVPEPGLSPHLRSRAEVGRILLDSGVPTAVLRAAVIIGSGSASFEMLRYLTERLPVMVTPRWVHTRIQPIAVRDVLRLLVGCARLPAEVSRTFDIGGREVLTYREMMQRYAAVAGLPRRLVVPVPVLTPGLSSHWVGLVTPVPASIARPLTESLRHEVVCRENDIERYLPSPPGHPFDFDRAVALALQRVREAQVATRWSSASVPGAPSDPLPTDPDWAGGSLYTDVRERAADVPPQALWQVIEGIGGENGWYSFPLAWAVRGWLDRLVGGVGLRRGRRDARRLRVGDSLDFWRVEEIERGRLLRLRAEMRLPGLAWLEMRVDSEGNGGVRYRQRALFHPHGLLGHLYWWSVAPFHAVVFGGMARNIVRAAARAGRGDHRTSGPHSPGRSTSGPAPPAEGRDVRTGRRRTRRRRSRRRRSRGRS